MKLLGLKVSQQDFDKFCETCDTDNSGTLDLEEIRELLVHLHMHTYSHMRMQARS